MTLIFFLSVMCILFPNSSAVGTIK